MKTIYISVTDDKNQSLTRYFNFSEDSNSDGFSCPDFKLSNFKLSNSLTAADIADLRAMLNLAEMTL